MCTEYEKLESGFLKAGYLLNVPVEPSDEEIVAIPKSDLIGVNVIDEYMRNITGDAIYVRQTVLDKLNAAARLLGQIAPGMTLEVVYGYRTLERQRQLYDQLFKDLKPNILNEEKIEIIHRSIALPEVSGHPTGGAVDLQPLIYGKVIDMGTKIWDFSKDSYTFSPFISDEAKTNRRVFRSVMIDSGFAPFDGEWWHYSYGDREWAAYYNEPNAIYEQLEFTSVNINDRMKEI